MPLSLPLYAVVVQGTRPDGRGGRNVGGHAAVGVPVRVANGTIPEAHGHSGGLVPGRPVANTGHVSGTSMH